MLLDIRTAADAGTPIVASAPDSEGARAYTLLAARVWDKVQGDGAKAAGPRIVIS